MGLIIELARAKKRIKELEAKLEQATIQRDVDSRKILSLGEDLRAAMSDAQKFTAKITELEADVADLLEQLALGVEKPSPADIVQQTGIVSDDYAKKFIVDMRQLNIPFTKPPRLLSIMEIPDTNSMDGIFDYGNNNLYVAPADEANQKIMVDWIAKIWLDSKGLDTVDAVTRIMANNADDPNDFSKPHVWYAIHRLVEVGTDGEGQYFWFAGVNNLARDPWKARERNIIWLNTGTVF